MMDDYDIKYLCSIIIIPFDGRLKNWHAWETHQLAKFVCFGWAEILTGKMAIPSKDN